MKANNKKRKTKYIVGLLLVAISASLLILSIVLRKMTFNSFFGGRAVRAEYAYVIMILGLLLLAFVFFMLISILVEGFYVKRKPRVLNVENATASIGVVSTQESKPQSGTKKAEDGEEEAELPSGSRFCKLNNLDDIRLQFKKANYDENITLRQFCDNFRNYAASRLKLYYSISDIRRFISGMAVSHIQILQGMSGTGKTSLAHAFGDFLENTSTVIPVQPMWKERTDLVGYYNEFTKRFNETTLLEKMYEANYSDDIYVTVLDEMNIARVEYYFAEFLSLLELPNVEERLLTVVSDVWEDDPAQLTNGCIKLPPNMWFIGTANNDDSTFAISDKVYDRAMIMNLDSKCEPFVAPKTGHSHVSAKQFEHMAERAMQEYEITARNMRRLEALDKYLIEHFHITFGNRIMKQIRCYIPVFVACGGDELEALDDILSKKILRKLEMQNPIYLRNASAGLCAYFDELFGDDRMPLCKDFMERLQRNI